MAFSNFWFRLRPKLVQDSQDHLSTLSSNPKCPNRLRSAIKTLNMLKLGWGAFPAVYRYMQQVYLMYIHMVFQDIYIYTYTYAHPPHRPTFYLISPPKTVLRAVVVVEAKHPAIGPVLHDSTSRQSTRSGAVSPATITICISISL